jgi:predicted alpha/beta hydrolase family esterase
MPLALILHGWYCTPQDNWYPWLKEVLESKGYRVEIPVLPTMDTDLPDMQAQLDFTLQHFPIQEDTILVGHSLGSLLALRIAEKVPVHKLYLFAGWDFDDLTVEHQLFWKTPIEHAKITENVQEIYCLTSDNDPYMTAFTVLQMSKRLQGKFVLLKGYGHFCKDGDPAVLELKTLGLVGNEQEVKQIPEALEYFN